MGEWVAALRSGPPASCSTWNLSAPGPGRSPNCPRGGIGSADVVPAMSPSARHGTRVPRLRRSSNSARSDRERAALHAPTGTSAQPPAMDEQRRMGVPNRSVPPMCALRHTSWAPPVVAGIPGRLATARARWPRSVVIGEPSAPGDTITRYRPIGSSPLIDRSRADSRSCRRIRFLTTADPTFREMAKATAGPTKSSPGTYTTLRGPLRARCEELWKRRNAARPLIRSIDPARTIRRRAAGGPCAGEL
jgi:hypothetical protein